MDTSKSELTPLIQHYEKFDKEPRAPKGVKLHRCLRGGNEINENMALEALEMEPFTCLREHVHRKSHSYIIFFDGSATFILDGVAQHASAGDNVLVPAGCWHEIISHSEG
mmetsp:Transcript_26242/g.48939  ORF Transcript_26242/g.48939 Transcript_26242/m.48939 type:complete len:110 (-) Transcript_26242:381-710(-)